MDASRRSDMADLEFESVPPPVTRLRDFDPRDHQRVVVNPFLAVVGVIGLIEMIRLSVLSWFPPLGILTLVAIPFLPQLLQIHCLDCGRTARYLSRNPHACPAVVARWNEGRSARFPWSHQQITIWVWILGAVGILLAVLA